MHSQQSETEARDEPAPDPASTEAPMQKDAYGAALISKRIVVKLNAGATSGVAENLRKVEQNPLVQQ